MKIEPKKDELKTLLRSIKRIEVRLDRATKSIELFCLENPDANLLEDLVYLSHMDREKFASQEWTRNFDAILNHTPQDFDQLKFKTLALIEYLKSGDADEQILETIKTDLEAFSLEMAREEIIERVADNLARRTLLLIDDNHVDRMLIKKALVKVQKELDFVELENGNDAVSIIKLNKPSMTLLDVRMPGIDGFDVLKLIRKDSELAEHPVWMISTSSEENDIEQAMEHGANGYYSKPESVSEYTELAQKIVNRVSKS